MATPRPQRVLTLPLSALVRAPGAEAAYAVFLVEDRDGVSTARTPSRHVWARCRAMPSSCSTACTAASSVIVRGAALVADGERVNPTR